MNQNKFVEELNKLNININSNQLKQLETYYELLVEYNKVMNLTGIVEKNQVYLKHFYDSLTIVKVIDLKNVEKLCDIGTGAGFPGIVLKILFPNLKVTLVDSLNKRINFLKVVIDKLNLNNIDAIHSRIEEYGRDNREIFDVVTCRAVAPLNTLLEYSIPLLKKNKYFIPLKGTLDNEPSIKNALKKLDTVLEKKEEFLLPIECSKRTVLRFKKQNETKKIFPRKYLEIKQKPL